MKNFKKAKTFNAKDIDSMCKAGIYFLTLEKEIVYVGMTTTSVADRLEGMCEEFGHRQNKVFDEVVIFEVEPEYNDKYYLMQEEIKLIKKHKPFYNIVHNPHKTEEQKNRVDKKLEKAYTEYNLKRALEIANSPYFNI